jgi:hypothetical protein
MFQRGQGFRYSLFTSWLWRELQWPELASSEPLHLNPQQQQQNMTDNILYLLHFLQHTISLAVREARDLVG